MQHSCAAGPLLGLALLTAFGLTARPVAAQGLTGQPVHVTHNFSSPGINLPPQEEGTQTVTPSGVSFNDTFTAELVTPTKIIFTPLISAPFGAATFNGYQTSETSGSPANIIGFLVDPATDVLGFSADRVSVDYKDVFVNFQGLTIASGQNVTLDIFSVPLAPVPEASTTVSFGLLLVLGMGILVFKARKKA